ncbi:transmembrane protein 138 isoform X1 [Varanus komodoensis]|nr:transmembrane protein 138 isoform X1 [Varanus komodoensis]XP_044281637.1 transmembrane protein 138 isoform X1 [Varanus komodoensis]XP_044281638.1 transmembrane protein 138 isoform X1 [Varanus komodoensis]XP_044281639.1 transmembrane protein 138 isoform X1 [Varanus komodoensis]
MLQTSNYSLVLSLQFLLLFYDLFVNSFSELLRMAPVIQLVLFIIQDIAILFNVIIIFLMFFNTFIFQAGLVNLLFHKFKGTIVLSAAYLALSISFHIWVMNLRWKNSHYFVWTDGLQALFVFQRLDRQLSSTPLEILLFLNGWYYATYFLLEIFIFVYKGLLLPYPSANLALDLIMLFLYLGIEVTRIFFGSKGNLCQRKVPLAISLALTFPAAVMAAYYLLLQTYALRLEAILNAILLLFYAVELLLGILTLAAFSSLDSY